MKIGEHLTYEDHAAVLLSFMRKKFGFLKFITKCLRGPRRDVLECFYKQAILARVDYAAAVFMHGISAATLLKFEKFEFLKI